MWHQLRQEAKIDKNVMDNLLTRLSQSQLNLLATCPRKFQHLYFEQLTTPLSAQQQEKIAWGNQFHLLMQQRELGLPITSLLGENEQLRQSLEALVAADPEILQSDATAWRAAEHHRTLKFQNYLLVVVYDLLIAQENRAQILDWKTYLQPENPAKLAQDWQTRLYLYVLAETSHYTPEQISLTYWFVKLPNQPRSLTFDYNSNAHEKTKQDLTSLLSQLDLWREEYWQGKSLPQVNQSKGICRHCNFALRCQRLQEIPLAWSVDDIEEVSLS